MRTVDDAGPTVPVPHYAYDLPTEEEARFEKLFRQLDANEDGRIDIHELSKALHEQHGIPESLKESYAQVGAAETRGAGTQADRSVAIILLCAEIHPAVGPESERRRQPGRVHQLRQGTREEAPSGLCQHRLGQGRPHQSQRDHRGLQGVGHHHSAAGGRQPAEKVVPGGRGGRELNRRLISMSFRMDKDGSLEISFNEWRDFLLFHPTTDLRDIMQYWRHSTVSQLEVHRFKVR